MLSCCRFAVCVFVCLFVCWFVSLFVCLFVFLFVFLFVWVPSVVARTTQNWPGGLREAIKLIFVVSGACGRKQENHITLKTRVRGASAASGVHVALHVFL